METDPLSDIDYSVITSDAIKSFDCINKLSVYTENKNSIFQIH